MAYAQGFGLSRNSPTISSSPLNRHTITHCDEDSKNSAGECVGFEYYQKKDAEDKKKALADKALQEKTGPLTDAEQTKKDTDMLTAVSKGEAEWAKDGKSWSSYPPSERPNGWSLPNAKGPDGSVSDNTFAQEDLDKADEAEKLKMSQARLGVTIGDDGEKIAWNDNYESNPNAGYKQGFENGKPIHNKRGDKMFLGDKDVTEEYYKTHNEAGGTKQTWKTSLNSGLDAVQEGLDYAGLATGVGAIPDVFNSLLGGIRGSADYLSGGDDYSKHFKRAGKSLLYAAPLIGDSAMVANKLSKFSKLNKKFNVPRNLLTNTSGFLTNKNLSKAIQTTSKGTKKRPSGEKLLSFGEGVFNNTARGIGNFAFRKNKNTQIYNQSKRFLNSTGLNSKLSSLGAEQFGKLTSAKGLEKLAIPGANASMDSIQNAFTGVDTSKIAQGGFAPQQDQFTKPDSKKVAEKVDTNPKNAGSIIEQNNAKSNTEKS